MPRWDQGSDSSLERSEVMVFPLRSKPALSYRDGGRRFGARRDAGQRCHAGCDLIAPEGSEILAVEDGEVVRGPYLFYHNTYAIEVKHSNFIARYCEISGVAEGIGEGTSVQEGRVIAYVGKMQTDSMLHFEMYSGVDRGPLTQRGNPPYQRRNDLIDPSDHLDKWAAELSSAARDKGTNRSHQSVRD
jgi:murein DD-endopeptidase MepM/ murein hydrolase activator NlpD